MMSKSASTLTEQQQRWVEEYLVDSNATEAARRAGCSSRSASMMGRWYLANPAIQELLVSQQAVFAAGSQKSRKDMIQGLLDAQGISRQQSNSSVMLSASLELAEL